MTDDDATDIALSVDPSSAAEDVETAPTVTVTASTDGTTTFATDRTMTVSVGDEKDSATEGTDYTAVDDFTVTITAGETSGEGTFTLTPENDNLIESNEAITLSGEVTAPAGSKLTVTDTEVTLTDDDLAQLPEPLKLAPVSLSADPSTVAEDAGVTKVKVTATVAQGMAFQEDRTVTVSVGESGDSATSGTDYKPVADFTITIKAEDSSGEYTFELTPTNDDVVEGDERITVSGTSQDIEVTGTQVTLADSDRAVVTVSDARAEEGEALTFTATLSGAVKVGVTVTPVYTDVTATMDVDYTASGEAVSFSGTAGETVSFAVPTVEDEIVELDETFMVGLTVSGAPPGVGTGEHGTGTIVNDDIAAASVADTSAEEGEVLVFTVTLDKAAAADGLVTMDYATEDGSARAGRDYTAVSGTLSFPAGETEATIEVETIDDALDEGEETLNLLLGRPVNAVLSDGSAVGTILNDDPLPTVWLTRCGRAAASHAADAVEARLHAEQAGSHLNLGGQTLAFGGEAADPAEVHGGGMRFGAAPEAESEDDLLDAESRAVTGRELAASSAFMLTQGGPAAAAGASRWTAWGSGASTHFEGYEGQLSLEGEVTGGTLGVDVERGEWTAGVAVSHNECTGTWNDSKSGHSGTVESPLTGVHPYLGWSDNRGLSLWGVAGLGQGELTVSPDGDERDYTTDIGMSMLALGGRRALASAEEAGGFDLAVRSDALVVWMDSEAAEDMRAIDVWVSRARLALEAGGSFDLEEALGGSLEHSLELGLRHDAGDAENGLGLEVGGELRYTDPARGLTVELRSRGLLMHQDEDYREWGAAGAILVDPGADGLGLTFNIQPSWGAPEGGVAALWEEGADVAAQEAGSQGRLDAELGWGLSAWNGRAVLTPLMGLGRSSGDELWRLGLRFETGDSFRLDLALEQTTSLGGETSHGVLLRGTAAW